MFEIPAGAEQWLCEDKHTLLEGYVTEYLYEKQWLLSSPESYTSGWWFAEVEQENKKKQFFFVVSEKLNDVDREVMRTLSKRYSVCRAYPIYDTWHFYEYHHDTEDEGMRWPQFCEKHQLQQEAVRGAQRESKKRKKKQPEDQALEKKKAEKGDKEQTENMAAVKDMRRQEACISFFESHDILRKIAIERHFADWFLSNYFDSLINVDYFILNQSKQLCAIEIKFKNEIKPKSFSKFKASHKVKTPPNFGINNGQFHMLARLEESGIEVQHWILYKGTYHEKTNEFEADSSVFNPEMSIFDFLDQKTNPNEKWWRYGNFHAADVIEGGKIAGKHTSQSGKRKQRYFEFRASQFGHVAPLLVGLD